MNDPITRADTSAGGLAHLRRQDEQLFRATQLAVLACRLRGDSWTTIGAYLGVTRQSAHRRWRWVDDHVVRIQKRDGHAFFAAQLDDLVVEYIDQLQLDQLLVQLRPAVTA